MQTALFYLSISDNSHVCRPTTALTSYSCVKASVFVAKPIRRDTVGHSLRDLSHEPGDRTGRNAS